MYFNVNFNVFFKLIKVHLLVSEHYIRQNARCKDKKLGIIYISVSVKTLTICTCIVILYCDFYYLRMYLVLSFCPSLFIEATCKVRP